MQDISRVLLEDWRNHDDNVNELTDAAILLTKKQSVMSAILTELKLEIEFTHEYWLRLNELGITNKAEARAMAYTQNQKEAV